jgi:Periplasmic binding protein
VTKRRRLRPAGRPRPLLLSVAALLMALLAVAGCSSSSSSSPAASSAASAPAAGTGSATGGPVAAGDEIGVTASQIHVAFIADVNTPVAPGLFQKSVDAVNAWAKIVNAGGGLAGHQLVVDFCDGKLDANATTNCVIQACQNDFAMITQADVLTDLSDVDGCKDKAGQAVGLPDLATIAFPPLTCDKDTYTIVGQASYCATAGDHPQTYTANIGDFRYYTSHFSGLHGIWVYNGDVPTVRIVSVPGFQAGSNIGIKKDGEGFYSSSGTSPQSAMTPLAQVLKQSGSTFGYDGSTLANNVLFRKEAQLQGVSSVKVWACNSVCYDPKYLTQGGSAVNGTYVELFNLPYLSEYQVNPTLAGLVKQMGSVQDLDNDSVNAYVEALLFQDVVQKAAAAGPLSRQALFTALSNEHAFNADGIIGTTDVGKHAVSPCMVMAQVVNGAWTRAYPAKPGTFDCSSANVAQIKMDLSQ